MRRRAFTAADAVVLGILFAANGFLWPRGDGAPAAVEIVSEGGSRSEGLGPPRELPVPGPLGETVVRLGPEGARIVASPCPLKLCVAAGLASRAGQVVACLPNRVALRIVGTAGDAREGGVDAVGR